ASLYLASNQPNPAITDLDAVISSEPANGTAFYNRGVAHELIGKPDAAVQDYRNAIRLLPAFAPARAALGRLLRAKDPHAALTELGAAIKLDPHSDALRSRGTVNLSLDHPEQALHDLDAVIAKDGSDSVAYLNRGVAHEKLGDLRSAIADYSRSIELAPSVSAYLDRANAYTRQQLPDRALADFNSAVTLDPRNIKALLGRADANYARNSL